MRDEPQSVNGVMPALVSVVIPVYRSESCLDALCTALQKAFEQSGRGYEIVLVNDCSPDSSWAKITQLAQDMPSIRGVSLRRNFGQDCALMAGLRAARGHIIVIMDDDLQHDPMDAESLIGQVEAGYDVCYAKFPVKRQAWWKNAGSWLNDKLAVWVLGKPKHVYLSPYKALARGVVDEIVKYDGPFPYIDGLIFSVTHHITQVPVEHHARYHGSGNFGLRKSISTWLRLATAFSIAPLRLATCLGIVFSVIGLALAASIVMRKLAGYAIPEGWPSMIVAVLVIGGVQLACLGLIGEYLGRAYLHLNRRPQYVVRETAGQR